MTKSLIGKQVKITSWGHTDEGSYGTVTSFDGEHYHVAVNGDMQSQLIFERSELRVPRNQPGK